MPAGGHHLDSHDDALSVLEISKNRSAPELVGPIYQEVARSLRYRRTDLPTDEYNTQFGLYRREAEAKMEAGAELPEAFASVSHMRNAALSRIRNASLAPDGTQKSLKFMDVALKRA